MKRLSLLVHLVISFALFQQSGAAQLLLEENFDYPAGDSLRMHGWEISGTSTVNTIMAASPGLDYPGYASSGIGNAASLAGTGQDLHRAFTFPAAGCVYISFMVNVTSALGGDYFLHFIQSPATSTFFAPKVFVRSAKNGMLAFGVSKRSNSPRLSDSVYAVNTTYLLVAKYKFNAGSATDDEASLYVFAGAALPEAEPGTPTVGPVTDDQADAASLDFLALRQGTSSIAPALRIDGIRAGTTWLDTPLAVTLTTFTATPASPGGGVALAWTTITEVDNFGFEVQRSAASPISFASVSALIPGAGTTNTEHHYSYIDSTVPGGPWFYRLKQVDLDGAFHVSEMISANAPLRVAGRAPMEITLFQNHPNPFNSTTTVHYELTRRGHVTMKVFDLLGRELAVIENGIREPGPHAARWDATGMPSGVYFCRLQGGGTVQTRKMVYMK